MTTVELIAQLIEANTPSHLVAEVAKRLFAADSQADDLASRREASRQSSQRHRDKRYNLGERVTSRDVTSGHVTSPPPGNIPPLKKEKKAKKLSSTAHTLPPDFELSEADHAFAEKRGWDEWRRKDEFQRFQDHAQATGRRLTDWHAGWRTWVMSPYNNSKNGAAYNGHHRETTADKTRRLAAQLGATMHGSDRSAGGDDGAEPDDVGLPGHQRRLF